MCLVCRCTHCKDGDCDGKHHAHDAIRSLNEGKVSERVAIALIMDDGMSEDEAKTYLLTNRDKIKPLQPYDWNDLGGGQAGYR